MVRVASLQELAQAERGDWAPDAACRTTVHSDEIRLLDIVGQALDLYRAGKESAALERLLNSRRELHYVPIPVISNIIWLCRRLGREQIAAHECLRFARDAFSMGYDDLGLEACSAAMILDALGSFEITRTPSLSVEVAWMYGSVAGRHRAPPSGLPPAFRDGPRRVALIVPNLVDHVVAATKRVLQFARHIDRSLYAPSVYVSENLSRRESCLFPFGCESGRSEDSGEQTLRQLRELDVPVVISPRSSRFVQSALAMTERIERDGADIAIFQGGLACPIDWLVAKWARVRSKLCIHTGCSMFVPGMTATFFDNRANIERERVWWSHREGERVHLPKGVDLAELRAQRAFARSRFGIPADAVVIGTLSNHLERRLSIPYMDVMAGALQENPNAWFLAFGAAELPAHMAYFQSRGVADRVRFGGRQSQVGSALKVFDIYANEFPVGGSQSVIEAMACGVPVLALRWSDAHAESVGAELAGDEGRIPSRDRQAYAVRLNEWIRSPGRRRGASLAARRRADADFSMPAYVRRLLDVAEQANAAGQAADRQHAGAAQVRAERRP